LNEYPEILILGRDTCEDTNRSRGHLHLLGIPYVYRNVELDPDADAWNRSFSDGERRTPVILVGDPARSPMLKPSVNHSKASRSPGPARVEPIPRRGAGAWPGSPRALGRTRCGSG
jgi:glutaredoxin